MRTKPMILISLLLAAFVINLDTTIVNVALPSLVRELHASTTQLQWVVDAYNLAFAALLLTCGALSDRLGRKGMLLAGLTVFGAASLAGGFTTSAAELIAARAVMGLGAAMSFPATLSLISNVFVEPTHRRMGIAKMLMDMADAEFKRRGVGFVALHATRMARPLYEQLGWAATNEMTKTLW